MEQQPRRRSRKQDHPQRHSNTNAQAASNGPPAALKNSTAEKNDVSPGGTKGEMVEAGAGVTAGLFASSRLRAARSAGSGVDMRGSTSLLGGGDGAEPLGKTFQCASCGKQFSTKAYLQKHLTAYHEVPPRCKVCQLVVKSQQSLLSHMNVHVQVDGKEMLHCVKCAVPFINAQALAHHFKSCLKPLPVNIQPDMDMPPPLPIPPAPPAPPAPPTHSEALPLLTARPPVAPPPVLPRGVPLPLFLATTTNVPVLLQPSTNLPAPTPPPAHRRGLRRLLPAPQVVPLTAAQDALPLDLSLPSKPPQPQRWPSLQQVSVAQADVRTALPLPVQVNQLGGPSVVLRVPSERQMHVRRSSTPLSSSVGGTGSAIGTWCPQSNPPVDQRQTLAGQCPRQHLEEGLQTSKGQRGQHLHPHAASCGKTFATFGALLAHQVSHAATASSPHNGKGAGRPAIVVPATSTLTTLKQLLAQHPDRLGRSSLRYARPSAGRIGSPVPPWSNARYAPACMEGRDVPVDLTVGADSNDDSNGGMCQLAPSSQTVTLGAVWPSPSYKQRGADDEYQIIGRVVRSEQS